jgi:aspartate carbamoyltransferase catalytic subunit
MCIHSADTIRTVEGYSDIIVLRHFESGSARRAADTTDIPVINAGDGPGQHPTQVNIELLSPFPVTSHDGVKNCILMNNDLVISCGRVASELYIS